jgi:CubicO group peptidase (beta-lactamase class C family)
MVIRDDRIMMQVFRDGNDSPPHTSFSVAKSFNSALIGAAIEDGYIESVNDPVIKYIPEIAGRGLDELTIRNLLRMDTGVRYRSEDDILAPFSDDSLTYYSPDLRKLALGVQSGEAPVGAAFLYNNFYPLLEGLIIERAAGMPVAEYLEQRIWQPMGAGNPASWSLDSRRKGFEKMESGINATPTDFARFGLLFLHGGNWNGRQILPGTWITESTAPDPTDLRPFESAPSWAEAGGYYGYHWWGMKNLDGSHDFMARGKLGQLIYVAPRKNMVVVRLGPEPDDGVIWSFVVQSLIDQML